MKKQVFKLTLASSLVSISVVLDIVFKVIIPNDNFGVPIYAIPLVIGSIILGPIYGAMMGLVSDVAGFFLMPRGDFNFLFSLSAMAWGTLPGLFLNKHSQRMGYYIVLFFTHLVATTVNTISLYFFVSKNYALTMLPLRIAMLPINVLVVGFISHYVLKFILEYGEFNTNLIEKK